MRRIDRRALVERHDVRLVAADPLNPLSVGNGELAYTVDVTGLQTLPDFHARGMRLGTHAQWGWHTAPNPHGFDLDDRYEDYETPSGRRVPYLTTAPGYRDVVTLDGTDRADAWLRENPHRLDLGRIGLRWRSGRRVELDEVGDVDQRLDLWRGRIVSRYRLTGSPVRVVTVCHPDHDTIAIRVESPLLVTGDLAVAVRFPYAIGDWHDPCVWDAPERHRTHVVAETESRCDLLRVLDDDRHHVAAQWSAPARWEWAGAHDAAVHTAGEVLELVMGFAAGAAPGPLPTFADVEAAASKHWSAFWSTGAAVDLAESNDARAGELERRIVLSQYLTAVHCAGSTPPAETGLVTNSWRGKFHLEMHWWHAAHFPLWGRAHLLERSMAWYERTLPLARRTHAARGTPVRDGRSRSGRRGGRVRATSRRSSCGNSRTRSSTPNCCGASAATARRWSGSPTSSCRQRTS